jgi:thiol:disulfide interchange protein
MTYYKELIGVILIVAAFFMALNEDAPIIVNVIGWSLLLAAVGGWIYAWINQNKQQ